MEPSSLGLHETMEIHEVLNFKTDSAMRSKLMQGVVQNKDLKRLLEQDVRESTKAMKDLRSLLLRTPTEQSEQIQ